MTDVREGTKRRGMYLHRFVLNAPDRIYVDHVNHDPLDNRKQNLRLCTCSQNAANGVGRPEKRISKYKGVGWRASIRRWYAQIKTGGRCKKLGYFEDEDLAAAAYDRAASTLWGSFAKLNLPQEAKP
jgi:hypothetical protein